ncbi:protein kinase [Gemmatimonadota bacterium]
MASPENTEARLKAALADRYAIEHEIDSGGMATVYRARDLKHDRTVAVKVLKPELAEAIGADRFLREIRTTANLSHPHILPLHDSGEAEGFLFYVMPFVEGESLRDRLEREGQLPVEEAVQIGQEISDALAYAHEKGVIHRDVKPANILLERGHALLADFGIAQAKAGVEETKLTGSGMSLGTPSYMSPEQIGGEGEVDGRADQYALGCVLYEMLAGRPPFEGADIQTVMRQHLAADPPNLTQARATVPKGVARAVHRALAKHPADRFRNMGEIETALAGATLPLLARIPMGRARVVAYAAVLALVLLGGGILGRSLLTDESAVDRGSPLANKTVVAIPLENRTGNADFDNLGELVAGFISSGLSQADRIDPGLFDRVIPFERLDRQEEPDRGGGGVEGSPGPRWAEETIASLAVVGSYFVLGDSIRFLLEVRDRSNQILESLNDVSAPVTNPAAAVEELQWWAVSAVAGHFSPGHIIARVNLQNHLPEPEALELYFQGRRANTEESRAAAVRLLEQAAEADPEYLAPLITLIWWYPDDGKSAKADSLCTVLEPLYSEMTRFQRLDMEGGCARLRGDFRTALEMARQNLEYIPNQVNDVAGALLHLNRPREALEYWAERDPRASQADREFTSRAWWRQAQAHHLLGEHEEELEVARQIRGNFPDDERGYRAMAPALAALGRVDELARLWEEWTARYAPHPQDHWLVAAELEIHGHPEDARRLIFEPAIQRYESHPHPNTAPIPVRYLAGLAYLESARPREARRVLESLVEDLPGYFPLLGQVGIAAARQGDTAEAHRALQLLAEFDEPWDHGEPEVVSAALLANLGEQDPAMGMLEQAAEKGFGDWIVLHRNLFVRRLWDYPPFQEFLRPKG